MTEIAGDTVSPIRLHLSLGLLDQTSFYNLPLPHVPLGWFLKDPSSILLIPNTFKKAEGNRQSLCPVLTPRPSHHGC